MISRIASRRRSLAGGAALFAAVSVLAAVASWPIVAGADNIKAQFPSKYGGTLWMSGRMDYAGLVYVTSSYCNAAETAAYTDIKNTTTGTPEMSRWATGIDMSRYRCDNQWDYSADLRITYKDQSYFLQPDQHYIGGRNNDVQASPDFCATWLTSYPCGSRPNVEINRQKFFGNSAYYEKSELSHETGHGLGLAHHCLGPAVMNDGSSGCPGGYQSRFGSAPGYFATDRSGINNVYP